LPVAAPRKTALGFLFTIEGVNVFPGLTRLHTLNRFWLAYVTLGYLGARLSCTKPLELDILDSPHAIHLPSPSGSVLAAAIEFEETD